jgi:hypothetical protein
MPNVFVVSSAPSSPYENLCKAILGFKNVLTSSLVSADSEDEDYPIELCYDFKTNTEFSPEVASGEVVIDIIQPSPSNINYVGIFSKNARDCELSFEVEVKDFETGNFVSVGTRGSFANASPQMISFDSIYSLQQRITINFSSKCYIASISMGEAVVFSRTVSAGYQPGRNSSLDEVSNFTTDGNNFIQGRRISNGYQEKASINYQQYTFVDTWWRDFMNHVLDSKPLFFMANNQDQNNCIFGMQNASNLIKPNYKNSQQTDVEFEINGWA